MMKRVYMLRGPDLQPFPLAEFRMEGESVIATFHNESYRREIEEDGIGYMGGGRFRIVGLADGRAFFEALDTAYSHSSFMRVEVVD
jgi:hypothetical protein